MQSRVQKREAQQRGVVVERMFGQMLVKGPGWMIQWKKLR